MEPGCKLEGFDRPAQPAVSNRLRCRILGGVWTIYSAKHELRKTSLCMVIACLFYLERTVFVPTTYKSNSVSAFERACKVRPVAFPSVHLSSKTDAEPLYRLRPPMRLLLRFKLRFQLRELQTEERFDSKTEA